MENDTGDNLQEKKELVGVLGKNIVDTKRDELHDEEQKCTPLDMVIDQKEDELWVCRLCAYKNDMVMDTCEFCQLGRPDKATIVKVKC